MSADIHPTAIVDKSAELGEGVSVGPYSIIGANVTLGARTRVHAHANIQGRTVMGEDCEVFPFAAIGQAPQDKKYKDEDTAAIIGPHTVLREYVTVHRGSVSGDGKTEVGEHGYIMAYCHVAHDCKVGHHVTMANYAGLAGHVSIGDYVVLGGLCGVHQHVSVGSYSMLGGMSRITTDVPPYVIAAGTDDPKLYGLNSIGLKRAGFSDETINELKSAYKIIFRSKLSLTEAVKRVQQELPYTDEIRALIEFIEGHKRGLTRG